MLPPGNGADLEKWMGEGYAAPDRPACAPKSVVSPFTNVAVQRTMDREDDGARAGLEMTVAGVDAVLDEVRPYLLADGGNVDVVFVRDGVVGLRLQGNCR